LVLVSITPPVSAVLPSRVFFLDRRSQIQGRPGRPCLGGRGSHPMAGTRGRGRSRSRRSRLLRPRGVHLCSRHRSKGRVKGDLRKSQDFRTSQKTGPHAVWQLAPLIAEVSPLVRSSPKACCSRRAYRSLKDGQSQDRISHADRP